MMKPLLKKCRWLGCLWVLVSLVLQPKWVMGVPGRAGFEEAIKYHSNTPIRVLLDRRKPRANLDSSLDHLYINYGAGWQQSPKRVELSIFEGREGRALMVGGFSVRSMQAFVRGGAHPADRIFYQGVGYQGALKITLEKDGLMLTNVLSLEDYLTGILASEMSPNWELEALKAQAVASRSYALYMQQHPRNPLYDVERNTQDQVYSGTGARSTQVLEAVRETEGEYLTQSHEPNKAYFHSRCGGETETADAVWQSSGRLSRTRVSCPFCRKHPFPWKSVFSVQALAQALRFPSFHVSGFRLTSLSRTPSGRISLLRADAPGAPMKKLTSDQFRALLGYSRIKSARFDWTYRQGPHGEEIAFEGVGSGHGVGMCQWGARYLAQQGRDYRQILGYFYPGVRLIGKEGNRLDLGSVAISQRVSRRAPEVENLGKRHAAAVPLLRGHAAN